MKKAIVAADELVIKSQTVQLGGRAFTVLCTALMMISLCLLSAAAAPSTTTIADGIKGGAEQLFNIMEAIVIPDKVR